MLLLNKFKQDHSTSYFQQVLIKGAAATVVEDQTAGFLGYCPQEDTLWPNLTMKEHMEIYAAVKGIRKDAAAVAIDRYGKQNSPLLLKGVRARVSAY